MVSQTSPEFPRVRTDSRMRTLEGSLETLGQALELAEPECQIRSFVDNGEPIARLSSDFLGGTAAKLLGIDG